MAKCNARDVDFPIKIRHAVHGGGVHGDGDDVPAADGVEEDKAAAEAALQDAASEERLEQGHDSTRLLHYLL